MTHEEAQKLVVQLVRDGRDRMVLSGALQVCDETATKLTAIRKQLREMLNTSVTITPKVTEQLTEVYDALNHCIIASRKIARGEYP